MEEKANKMELNGTQVFVRIDEGGIFARDKNDQYNLPSLMTQSKRGVTKAMVEIVKIFDNETTTFNTIWEILNKHVKKVHYWCAMD